MTRLVSAYALAAAIAVASAPDARAEDRVTVDFVAYRFASPELGGWAKARYVTERVLGFETRLEALDEQLPWDAPYQDRLVRAAVDHHVAEEILAGLPLEPKPTRPEIDDLALWFRTALVERVGTVAVEDAARKETVGEAEIHALMERRARAALYIDRALSPILRPTDEQLREVFRTSAHPYRGQRYGDVRAALERWFVGERLRVAESTFYQSARTRVKIVVAGAASR